MRILHEIDYLERDGPGFEFGIVRIAITKVNEKNKTIEGKFDVFDAIEGFFPKKEDKYKSGDPFILIIGPSGKLSFKRYYKINPKIEKDFPNELLFPNFPPLEPKARSAVLEITREYRPEWFN